MSSSGLGSCHSAIRRLEHAASAHEPWPEAAANELINFVYHTYQGDPSELPDKHFLYTLEGAHVVFDPKVVSLLHDKTHAVAIAAIGKAERELPVCSTAIFHDKWDGDIPIDYTEGIILPDTTPEEVRIFASLPIPLPMPLKKTYANLCIVTSGEQRF